ALARQTREARQRGFTTFKLKSHGFPDDLERLGAVRQAASNSGQLRLDCNGEVDLRHLVEFRPFHLELVEQPLPEGATPAEWAELAAASGLSLAVDESLADRGQEWANSKLTLAAKLATVGGPQSTLELLNRAQGEVLLSSSHETSIGIAAALAVGCALQRQPLACGLATRQLLEADLAHGLAPEGPTLSLPHGPGLGVVLNWPMIERYRLDR
ncbi:MAG: enolase C-terminal domain-like protein, partial [Candidatus Dormibacteraceae bacterium]